VRLRGKSSAEAMSDAELTDPQRGALEFGLKRQVLAVELTSFTQESARTHHADGAGESELGRKDGSQTSCLSKLVTAAG
jgi:hypothetical protein